MTQSITIKQIILQKAIKIILSALFVMLAYLLDYNLLPAIFLFIYHVFFIEKNNEYGSHIIPFLLLFTTYRIMYVQNISNLFINIQIHSLIVMWFVFILNKKDSFNEYSKIIIMDIVFLSIALLGIGYIYGTCGSFILDKIHETIPKLDKNASHIATLGIFLLLIFIFFKNSAAPFHFLLPDLYSSVGHKDIFLLLSMNKVAFVSTLGKIVSIFSKSMNYHLIENILFGIGLLSMFIGSSCLIYQSSIRKKIAYVEIFQFGTILILTAVGGNVLFFNKIISHKTIIMLIILAFSMQSLSVCLIFCNIDKKFNTNSMYNIFNSKNKLITAVFIISMMSLSGIPVTLGFITKMLLFANMLSLNSSLIPWVSIPMFIMLCIFLAVVVKISTNNNIKSFVKIKLSKTSVILIIISGSLNIFLATFIIKIIPYMNI